MTEDEERAAVIAASGSGGSAQGMPPQMAGTMRFGEQAFGQEPGGPVPELRDDHGNLLVAQACGREDCIGSHIWTHESSLRCYCAAPSE
jgi:hypothetical protein